MHFSKHAWFKASAGYYPIYTHILYSSSKSVNNNLQASIYKNFAMLKKSSDAAL